MASVEERIEDVIRTQVHMVDGILVSTDYNPIKHLTMLKSWKMHPKDVIVAGYPKSGNVWLVTTLNAILRADDLDRFEKEGPAGPRRPIEDVLVWDQNKMLPHPAVQMSHMRYRMLPDDVKSKGINMIQISRNPKDVCVSFFHYMQMFKPLDGSSINKISWNSWVKLFIEQPIFGNWFEYTEDWLQYRNDPNILFIQYEEFLSDPCDMIQRLSEHIGKQLTSSQIERIAELINFKSMRENPSIDVKHSDILDNTKGRFVRKGKVGDWKNHFSRDQNDLFDKMYEKLLKENDFHINFE